VVEALAGGETVSLTGQVGAKDQTNLAFRLDGRMIERHANLGDLITAGQVVARHDPLSILGRGSRHPAGDLYRLDGAVRLLIIPVMTVLNLMSGATTPMESMPLGWQYAMQFTPTPHYVTLAQAVLYRGAGLDIVWPQLAVLVAFTAVFLAISLMRFRKAIVNL
jgi:hypothetical protein